MTKVTRSVQYRYLDRDRAQIGEKKLDQVLLEALKETRDSDVIGKKVRARIADLNQSGQLTVWNGLQGFETGTVIAGELVLYRQGFDIPAIEERLDGEGNRFDLVRFQTDGKSKPIEGAAYFAVIGDHVGIIQSNAVTGRWLERYFTWLLKDATSIIDGESVIALSARIGFDPKDMARAGPAKALTLHANPDIPSETTDTLSSSRTFRAKRKGKGATVVEILKLMGLDGDAIESIKADIPTGGSLEGDFLVFIKQGNNRKQISVGTMDYAFRNAEPGDIDIERKGSSVRNNLQTFSEPVRVQETPIGLDPNDAIERIIGVLHMWNKNGIVNLGPTE